LPAGFVMVKLSDEVALSEIVAGVNVLEIDGGASTAMLDEAVNPVLPSVDVTALVTLF
jgi:hypothetical protein